MFSTLWWLQAQLQRCIRIMHFERLSMQSAKVRSPAARKPTTRIHSVVFAASIPQCLTELPLRLQAPRCQARHQGYNQANSHKSKPSKQVEPKWKTYHSSNLPARLKGPPKLPSSHETRREWFPTRQNVLAPLIVLRLLGKL